MKTRVNKWIISVEVFLIVLLGMCIIGMLMRNADVEAKLAEEQTTIATEAAEQAELEDMTATELTATVKD